MAGSPRYRRFSLNEGPKRLTDGRGRGTCGSHDKIVAGTMPLASRGAMVLRHEWSRVGVRGQRSVSAGGSESAVKVMVSVALSLRWRLCLEARVEGQG